MPPWSFWWGQRDKSTDSNIKPQPKLNSHNVCCSCGLGQFNQYFWGWIIFYKGYNPVNNKALPLRNALSTCFSDNISWRLIYALIKCLDAPKWAGLMPTVIKHWFLHCQNIIEGTVFMFHSQKISSSLEQSQKRSREDRLNGEKLFSYEILKNLKRKSRLSCVFFFKVSFLLLKRCCASLSTGETIIASKDLVGGSKCLRKGRWASAEE